MIKTLLLSSALITWPFVVMAQDVPKTLTPADTEKLISSPCPHPITMALNDKLVKEFDLTTASFIPISKELLMETEYFTSKIPDEDGDLMVVSLGTFIDLKSDGKVLKQCVLSINFTNPRIVDAATKRWEAYKKAGGHPDTETATPTPTTPPVTPPGTTVPVPTLKDDQQDKDD